MLQSALTLHRVTPRRRIAYKTLVTLGVVALAVALPQAVHLALGQPGGVQWLPMYLPVLLGGCLLGAGWGLAAGLLSPLVSFALTSLLGSPMPAAARLPFMMAELAVFAAVSGLFSSLIAKKAVWAFPAVWLAQLAGRGAFLGLVALFGPLTSLALPTIWQQVLAGWPGLAVQAAAVPLLVIALRALLLRERRDD